MANLGSDNTPIEGESFGLPSGFSIDENSGNLAIRDTNGNVVAEWDETNAQWDFANNTLNNVDALNSNSVSTVEATITGTFEGGTSSNPLTASENVDNPTNLFYLSSDILTEGSFGYTSTSVDGDNDAVSIRGDLRMSLVLVGITNIDDDTIRRNAIIRFNPFRGLSVIDEGGDPITTSFSEAGFNLELAIDEAGESYNVTTAAIVTQP